MGSSAANMRLEFSLWSFPVPTPLTAADFGWGGAFLDLNNDGRPDIWAPAGFVTVRAEVAESGARQAEWWQRFIPERRLDTIPHP